MNTKIIWRLCPSVSAALPSADPLKGPEGQGPWAQFPRASATLPRSQGAPGFTGRFPLHLLHRQPGALPRSRWPPAHGCPAWAPAPPSVPRHAAAATRPSSEAAVPGPGARGHKESSVHFMVESIFPLKRRVHVQTLRLWLWGSSKHLQSRGGTV